MRENAQKIGRSVHADGHIVEVPRKGAALANQHIQKLIARHVKIVLARVAYRHTERNFIRVHKLHGVYGLFKVAVAASAIARRLSKLPSCQEHFMIFSTAPISSFAASVAHCV